MATESDNVNSGALGTLVAVGTIAFFGIALVVTALVRAELAEETAKKELGADRPYRDLIAEQTAKLSSPAAYVDRERGVVTLPIERAMELTVADLVKDPSSATPPSAGGSGGSGGGAAETAGAGGAGGAGAGGGASATASQGGKAPNAAPDGEKPKDEKAPAGAQPKPAPVAPTPAPAAPSPVPAAPAPAPVPAP